MDAHVVNLIPPFNFLTPTETEHLLQHAHEAEFADGRTIVSPQIEAHDQLFLLTSGRVRVQANEVDAGLAESFIDSPSYFGERAVFFDQPRQATVIADGPVKCIVVSGSEVRALIEGNCSFSQAFAAALRTKQRIFLGYDNFVNLLFTQAESGLVKIRELIEAYRELNSVLHQAGAADEIDFDALAYVLPRLPENLTAMSALFLTEDLPDMYRKVRDAARISAQRATKREFYEVLPGKGLILLRDETTDTVDLITKLCIYAVEAAKIRDRLLNSRVTDDLARYAVGAPSAPAADRLRESLPFNATQLADLDRLFGDRLLSRLYEILVQFGDIAIYVKRSANRYTMTASELWLNQIRDALDELMPEHQKSDDLEVHIVSSNTHSVANCLSTWIREHTEEILTWAEEHSPECLELSHPENRLYVAARQWQKAYPKAAADRAARDRNAGIYSLDDTQFTGIEVNLIDLAQVGDQIDQDVPAINNSPPKLIVNIDYAYGQQAESIIRNLILLFGNRIRSISVFGKSGAVVGNRGDMLLPSRFMLQTNDELYTVPNCDLSEEDFRQLNFGRAVHSGTLLTVLGTIMQSGEMLRYYRTFWDVIGMEMEGSYYLREILRARSQGTLRDDVRLRFAYYTSDTPLEVDSSLAAKLSIEEGVVPVYAITRVVLRRILDPSS